MLNKKKTNIIVVLLILSCIIIFTVILKKTSKANEVTDVADVMIEMDNNTKNKSELMESAMQKQLQETLNEMEEINNSEIFIDSNSVIVKINTLSGTKLTSRQQRDIKDFIQGSFKDLSEENISLLINSEEPN